MEQIFLSFRGFAGLLQCEVRCPLPRSGQPSTVFVSEPRITHSVLAVPVSSLPVSSVCVCVCVFFSGIMGQFLGASETIVRATAKCGLKLDSTGLTRASQSPSTDIDRHWREKEHTCMSVVFIRSAAHLLSHTLIFSGIAPLQPGNHICKIR